jgi:cytochrome b subunit of formate dehydrogenase
MRAEPLKIICCALYALAFSFPLFVWATEVVPEPEVIREHPALFQYFLGVMILFNMYLVLRWIKAAQVNNENQWKVIRDMRQELTVLKTEQDILHRKDRA